MKTLKNRLPFGVKLWLKSWFGVNFGFDMGGFFKYCREKSYSSVKLSLEVPDSGSESLYLNPVYVLSSKNGSERIVKADDVKLSCGEMMRHYIADNQGFASEEEINLKLDDLVKTVNREYGLLKRFNGECIEMVRRYCENK